MIAREKPAGDEQRVGGADNPTRTDDVGSGPSPFDPLFRHFGELQMLVGHYLRARADQISSRVRSILFWAIAGIIGLILAVAFLVTSVVLVLHGIAAGLARAGLQPWAAELTTGVVCIAVVAVGLAIVSVTQRSAARRKRRDNYEHFRARYRAKFGRSFDDAKRNN
jgi:hypothetical protein